MAQVPKSTKAAAPQAAVPDAKGPKAALPAVRWIVLLNKSPKGPLTTLEVKTLVDRQILRLNDLGFQIGPDEKPLSDWKLLWQFAEFNRRGDASVPPAGSAPKPPEPKRPALTPEQERRRQMSEEEAKRRIIENLPPDLAEINPEDLVAKPSRTAVTRLDDDVSVPLVESPADGDDGIGSFLSSPFTVLGGLVAAVSFCIFFFYGPRTPTKGGAPTTASSAPHARELPPIAPAKSGARPGAPVANGVPRPGARPLAPVPAPAPPPPVARAPEAREPERREPESRYDTANDRDRERDREVAEEGDEENAKRDDEGPRRGRRRRGGAARAGEDAAAEPDQAPQEGGAAAEEQDIRD